jgi:O-antigen/teichoic acid export membrane protein
VTSQDLPPHVGTEQAAAAPAGRRAIMASGVWVGLSTVVPLLGTAALSVVAGRVLGAELLGQQSLISFSGALLTALLIVSLTDASIRTLAALRRSAADRVASLERWTFRVHAATGVLTGGALAGYGLLRGEFVSAWLVLALTVVLDGMAWGWSSQIIARDGWGPVARRRLITQVLAMVLGIAAVLAGLGITGIFLGAAAATLVLLVLLRPIVPRSTRRQGPALPRPVLRLWLLFAVGAALTQVVSGRIEILFLGVFATGEAIAYYSVAVMLVTSAVALPASLASAAMPAVAAASGAGELVRAQEAFVRALRVTAVLSLPLTALIVAVGPAFVVGLYGSEFVRAGELTRYVGLGAVVIPCGRLAAAYWSGLGRLRLPIVAGLIGACLEITLALVLIPRFGASGAVATTLAGQGVAAALLVALSWRSIGRIALGLRGCLAAAAASLGAAAAGTAATAPGGLPGAVTGGLATVAVFVVLAALLGRLGAPLLDEADERWLAGSLPGRFAVLLRPLTRSR